MNKHLIGLNAGVVWRLLNDNNRWSYCELKKAAGSADRDLNAAIGGLARENKIDFDCESPERECYFLSANIFIG